MRSLLALAFPALLLLPACTTDATPETHSDQPVETIGGDAATVVHLDPTMTPSTGDPVADLRAHVAALTASPEHDAERVQVQHLLVSFAGAGTRASRSKQEAEALAADLWAQILAGADFDALVKEHTDDSYPGIYTMVPGGGRPPTTYNRGGMVPAFGNVGWRLDVGEFGVAGFDAKASPYGWHIVKRTE
ncbi:peptidylprolyl isomerase [Engelhardtia mirabilis]|uniref:PPIC-type PPIASE domain protein n=1 Tax=Engelhardtia mirabilis TaxID=2528011 RepID=A0A518BEJ2_9BACT|nr:PPIC-type PPIASE domain protein [Planctomycetes bacterium Pla133]QDU99727.1 PPIC-type PPIASE domain protein [Planctomycetes bacterium Pla86]